MRAILTRVFNFGRFLISFHVSRRTTRRVFSILEWYIFLKKWFTFLIRIYVFICFVLTGIAFTFNWFDFDTFFNKIKKSIKKAYENFLDWFFGPKPKLSNEDKAISKKVEKLLKQIDETHTAGPISLESLWDGDINTSGDVDERMSTSIKVLIGLVVVGVCIIIAGTVYYIYPDIFSLGFNKPDSPNPNSNPNSDSTSLDTTKIRSLDEAREQFREYHRYLRKRNASEFTEGNNNPLLHPITDTEKGVLESIKPDSTLSSANTTPKASTSILPLPELPKEGFNDPSESIWSEVVSGKGKQKEVENSFTNIFSKNKYSILSDKDYK